MKGLEKLNKLEILDLEHNPDLTILGILLIGRDSPRPSLAVANPGVCVYFFRLGTLVLFSASVLVSLL